MQYVMSNAEALYTTSPKVEVRRAQSMLAVCLFTIGLAACGYDDGSDSVDGASAGVADVTLSRAPETSATSPARASDATGVAGATEPATGATTATASTSTTASASATASSWQEVAIRDMRAPDGSYALNDDKLLHRTAVTYSSQYERATLVMGRYATSEAFTSTNPDYYKELSYLSSSHPVRSLATWPRILVWDHVYLGERFGANHAPGYTGNSRVRTWGYEMWIKSKSGVWKRLFRTDSKGAAAYRPTFRVGPVTESYALDMRKEADGSTSVRPLPARGLDSEGTYWFPHGYSGGRQNIDPYDVGDVLVLAYSQLVLNDPNGVDDRRYARFLFGIGADWYPPEDRKDITFYPSVGVSRHKYVTIEPQLHVMHTMTEAEFRANPPPR